MKKATVAKATVAKTEVTKKYSMTKEGDLYRVTALRDFGSVKKGTVGGLIEKEENLIQEGTCWVYGNAQVYGDAQVYGNALVSGDAQVFGNALVSGNALVYGDALVSGNAQVSGDAQVYGDAQVSGDARVSGTARVYGDAQVSGDTWTTSPLYIQGSKHSLTNCKNGHITIGCETHTFEEWEKNYREIADKNNYTGAEIKEYYEHIKYMIKTGV